MARPYHPKRPRRSIKLDRIHPRDLRIYQPAFFCEQCSHFDSPNGACTVGYRALHTKKEQMALYEITGMMALCRFLEID
jgi:hypothetical protein